MGLSNVNRKIQRVLKATFFKEIVIYGSLNYFFIRSFAQLIMKKKANPIRFIHPEQLKIGKQYFSEVKKVTSLKIPNNGYWCKEHVDVDFIRDYNYLSTRFFHNFNSYYFYHLLTGEEYDSCYFVVRPILYKIAKLNKIGLVLYITNIGSEKPLIKPTKSFSVLSLSPLLLQRTQEMDYIATSSCHLLKSATSLATGADADYDFLRRDIKSLLYNQYPKV